MVYTKQLTLLMQQRGERKPWTFSTGALSTRVILKAIPDLKVLDITQLEVLEIVFPNVSTSHLFSGVKILNFVFTNYKVSLS